MSFKGGEAVQKNKHGGPNERLHRYPPELRAAVLIAAVEHFWVQAELARQARLDILGR